MRSIFLLIFLCSLKMEVTSQNLDYLNSNECDILYNESYGVYKQNLFDIILPKNSNTHSLVIYIHGGGFIHGDKTELYSKKDDLLYFLKNNIAVATINYRYFRNDDSLGVKVCLEDITRALQYIRFNSKQYNIDKERIGVYGGSAGAGSSLYLAFHDDMAIIGNTTLLGESTRVKCAGAFETQATYDLFAWKRIIPWLRTVTLIKRKYFYNSAANFYGFKDYKSFKSKKKEITKSLDMLGMIDSNDPPIYLMNMMKENFPKNNNIIQHHKKHAIAVSKVLNKNNVENYLFTEKSLDKDGSINLTFREFLVNKLK